MAAGRGWGLPGRARVPWSHRSPEAINCPGQETVKEICHPRPRGYSGESSNPGRVPADLVQRAIRVLAHFLPLCSIIRTPPTPSPSPPPHSPHWPALWTPAQAPASATYAPGGTRQSLRQCSLHRWDSKAQQGSPHPESLKPRAWPDTRTQSRF